MISNFLNLCVVMYIEATETMRLKLLKEEQKMRSKQPKPWTEIKYRRYANFGKAKKTVL